VDRVTLTTRMAPDGALYFLTPRGRLYVGKHEGTLYLYRVEGNDPWLRLLLAALPRLPLAYRDKLSWRDHVPVGLITTGPRRALLRLAASLWPGLAVAHADLAFVDRDRVESVVTAELAGPARAVAHLDPRGGLARVEFNDLELRRIVHEKA
jgi:hypothetical protein